jgi:hypothetical protein
MSWMRLSAYCKQQNETRDMITKRVKSGHWLAGVHVRKPDGSRERWVNMEAHADWAAGKKPNHLHGKGAR